MSIAIVKSIVGQVIAISPEGTQRVLVEGDRVFAGEQIQTGPGGAVSLELADGRILDLGRDTQWSADAPDSVADLSAATAQAAPSVDELQQAIAAGADPTTALEATAAGPTGAGVNPGGVGGGHSFVMLEAVGGSVAPTIGFPTGPLGVAVEPAREFVGNSTPVQQVPEVQPGPQPIAATLTLSSANVQEGGLTSITGTLSQPAGRDFTVTLSNGQTLSFKAGETVATTGEFTAQSDDVFRDGEIQNITVIHAGDHGFGSLNTGATSALAVTDTVDTVRAELSISPNPAVEGQAVTYTITLTGPAGADLTQHGGLSITLSNGEVINIPAGQISASQTANLTNDVYVGSSAASIAISAITEQGTGKQVFENLVKGDPVTLQITDEPGTPGNPGTPGAPNGGDEVTLTLTGNAVQERGQTTITGTLSHPAGQAFTVTLNNGQTLTFAKDATTATTAPFVAQSDDVFKDGETQTISVTDAGTHNFENLNTSATTTVTVSDTVDTVKAELSISPNPAVEGQAVTYTITLTGPAGAILAQHGGLSIALSNGEVINIPAGQISASQTANLANDVYVGSSAPSIAITGITEQGTGKQVFENLIKGDPVTLQITDEPGTPGNPGILGTPNGGDEVTLILTGNAVQEGNTTTITGTLSHPAGQAFTVTLSNGQTLTFAKDAITATTAPFVAQGDDVFKDGETQTVSVIDAGSHNFENLNTSATTTVIVSDTVDTVKAELSISPNPAVEGQAVTYTITLTGPAGADLSQHGGLSVALSNGEVINIPAGQVSASQTANLADDVYVGSSAPSIAISGITEQGTGKQVFENLVKGDPVTLQITDEPGTPGNPGIPGTPNGGDEVTLTLTGNAVQEGNTTTITGTLSHPAGQAFTVTLSNGQTLTFAKDAITATTAPFVAQGDDVFKDGETQTISVTNAGNHNFENLNTSATTIVTVSDTVDTVKAELSISPNPALEGQAVTYTTTLTGPAGAVLTQHGGLDIALSNGKVIHIPAGEITGSQIASLADDVYVGSSAPSIAITGITEQGTGSQVFENLVKGDPVTLQITDEPGTPGNPGTPGTPNGGDEVTLTLTGNAVQEGGQTTITGTLSHPAGQAFSVTLSNGQTLSFAKDATTATTAPFVAQSDDVFKDGETQTINVTDAGSHNFENLNTSATTTVTVSDTVDTVKAELSISPNPAVEGQAVTYTITLTGPAGADLTQHGGLSIALSNGEVINIPAGHISASQTASLADNVYVGSSAPSIAISGITEQGTGRQVFENLVKGDTVTLQITDEPGTPGNPGIPGTPNGGDEVTLILTGNAVQEGNTTTITGTLSHPAGQAFTVTLSNGQTLNFAKDATTATTAPFVAQGDDVFKDGETQTISVTNAGNHNFENLNTSATTTVTVSDTVDTVKAELCISPNPAVEGQSVTYTIILTGPAGADLSQHGGLSIALSNGEVINIPAGQISASQTANLANDVYVGSSAPSIAITGITEQGTGKQVFENLVKGDPVTLQITDEPGTPGNPGTPGTPNGGDEVTLILTGNAVQEGNTTTITGTLSHPAGQAFTVTLSNGQTLTFAKDATTATTAPFVAQSDDVFKDGETQTISVTDAGTHNFENLNTSATTTVTVSDTVDTVKAELCISPNPAVEGQAVTYTITLTGPAGADLTQHGGLSIALSNGEVINIPAGHISASQTANLADNVYVGSSAPSIAISGITEQGTGSQVFENLVKGDPVTLQITDEPGTPGNPGTPGTPNGGDEVTLTLTGNAVQEGNTTTITGTLSHPAGQAFTVTLSNGQTLSFAKDATTATTAPFVPQSDDVFKDGETQTIGVTNAGNHNFENLNTSATTTVTVSDTVDTVKAELSISPNPAVEGQAVTYTITLTGPAGADLSQHGGLSIALSNGEVINIPAGQVSASQTANLADDVYVGSSAPSIAITGITEQGTGTQVFENLIKGDPVTLQITDEPGTPGTPNGGDEVTLILTGNAVQEGNTTTITGTLSHPAGQAFTVTLSNGQTLNFAKDATTATTAPFVAQGDDVFKDGETQTISVTNAGNHNFENLNTSATTTVTVSDTVDTVKAELCISPNPAVEGQAVTYTITLTGPAGADLTQHGGLSIALSNGEVINIPAGHISASQTANLADNVYVGSSAPSIAISGITEQGTGSQVFENLVKGDPVTLQITDEPGTPGNPGTPGTPNGGDEVTLTLTGNAVQEGNTTTITGTLSHPAGQAFTVTLSNGQTLNFAKDATTATTAPFVAQGDDVFKDGETQTISVTNAGNHNFENLNTSATTALTVTDTINTVTVVLIASPNPAAKGQEVTYTVNLEAPAGMSASNHGGLTIKLDNGLTIMVAAGSTTGTVKGAIPDGIFAGGGSVSVGIDQITQNGTGSQVFENLVPGASVAVGMTNATPTITSGAALVSEEGLIGGNKDTVGSPADQSDSKSYTGKLTVSDIDTPSANLSVSLAVPSTALTSSGQSVQWALSNGGKTLTGTAGGRDVIEIRIDNAGNYTVELKGPLDHPNQAAEDVLSLNVGVSVSDGSTSSTGTLTISVEDDSPTFATSDNASMWNTAGYTVVGDTHFLAGGDGMGTLKFGTIVGLPSGWSSKATDASGTTVEVFDGTTKVFTLALGADGHYTVTQNAMREGSRDTFNLEGLKSGNTSTLSVTFNSGITATFEALASATGKPTINVGNGLGVGNNHFSANEMFSVAFTDAQQHGISLKEVTLGIARLQVSGNVDIIASYKDTNGVVHEATKTYTITSGSESIKVLASDFAGLAGHAFDTITLAAPNKSTLDTTFTKLAYVEEKPASDLNFTVHVIGTDHDGDSASSSFVVTSHGDAASTSMSTMSLMAGDASDSSSSSLLGSDDHILFVGAGDSTVTGSSGTAESFVWSAGDTGHDVIRNFNAEEGDRLDLSALLQGESLSALDSYLKITTADGESTLQVSTQGKFTPGSDTSSADVSIKLEGVNWSNTTVSSLVSGGDPTIRIDHSEQ